MNDISVGPGKKPHDPARRSARAPSEDVDAQDASEFDTKHGVAGAEAKPFAADPDAPPEPVEDGKDPDGPARAGLISGRRNAGRSEADGS